MSSFDEAQKLFTEYQKSEDFSNLKDSLDLLDEIILNNAVDFQKAINFRSAILRVIENQIRDIRSKCNIPAFAKDIGSSDAPDFLEKAANVLAACFAKEDFERFMELLSIKTEYFKQ